MITVKLQVSILDRQASSNMAALFDRDVISATPPLTNVEVVIVKDRCLTFKKTDYIGFIVKLA